MPKPAEIVRELYERFNRGDIEGVLETMAPDVHWQVPASLPFGGSYRGAKEVGRFFAALPGHFRELRVEPLELIESGDTVVALGRHLGKGARGAFDVPFAMVWRVRDGKVAGFAEHQDTAAILKAI